MPEKYKNKYRIASARAEWWDYSANAAYFITICTANRAHYFGEINNGKMNLSNAGILADVFWHEIKNHSQKVELDAFVVMPNHIHGILILNNDFDVQSQSPPPDLHNSKTLAQQRFQNQGKNTVSSIIGSYKSAVTKHANRLGLEFGWQARFHDHIIRNDEGFIKISNYIESNVTSWNNDKFYS